VIAPKAMPQQPHRGVVRARDASRRRQRRLRLNANAMLARIGACLLLVVVPVIAYVMLMANITTMNYTLARETTHKQTLQEETIRLDDQIARLQSRDRLADVAAKLHMHEAHAYAVIDLPRPVVAPPLNGIAFLGSLFHH
jgi:hypothetical protein